VTAPAGRTFERKEPVRSRLVRATLLSAGVVSGPVVALCLLVLRDALRVPASPLWLVGTGGGVAAACLALGVLRDRASRRRYGKAQLFPDGATFAPRGQRPRHLVHSELELLEVTEHGVLLGRRGAGRRERWLRPLLVPTDSHAASEALVAEVSEWTRLAHSEPSRRALHPRQ
jgi:hypothetical protein